MVTFQQEKEALDDISTELELTDEDQPVLCVPNISFALQEY